MSIYFTTMEDLIEKLKKDRVAERKGRGRGYNKSVLVIVDEVGLYPDRQRRVQSLLPVHRQSL